MFGSVFKYGTNNGLIETQFDSAPRSSDRGKRILRAGPAKRPDDVRSGGIADDHRHCRSTAKAMILLGINCGFGNSDVGKLPNQRWTSDADGFISPAENSVDRRCPLWPETIAAIQGCNCRSDRRQRIAESRQVGIHHEVWRAVGEGYSRQSGRQGISQAAGRHKAASTGPRVLSLAAHLRDDRRRVAGPGGGRSHHGPRRQSMAAVYRERISDERLQAVVNHVQEWLFAESE